MVEGEERRDIIEVRARMIFQKYSSYDTATERVESGVSAWKLPCMIQQQYFVILHTALILL